jgi:hypothetical protein
MTATPLELLLADLAARGIEVQAHGDRLRFRPPNAVTPDLVQRLKTHKAELLVQLAPPAGRTVPADPWDAAEAERLLSELRDEVATIKASFGGRTPAPLANVLAEVLRVAAGYLANHEREARRGWDALALLRGMVPLVRRCVQNWKQAHRGRESLP